MNIIDEHILRSKQVMVNDINSLKSLYETLDWDLIYKVAQLLAETHSIFVSGIGKSGIISQKSPQHLQALVFNHIFYTLLKLFMEI